MNNIKIDNQKMEDHLRTIFREKAERENRLQKIKDIMKGNERKRARRRFILIGIPVIIAAILVLWISVIHPPRSFDANEFYNLHFISEINEISYRDIDNSKNPANSIIKTGDLRNKINLGKQAMVDENWQEAEEAFSQLLPLGGSFQIESLWHLSLIQLKAGDLAQCKTYLKELIATKDPTYIKQARKLMRVVT